jgi:hypothetical protein
LLEGCSSDCGALRESIESTVSYYGWECTIGLAVTEVKVRAGQNWESTSRVTLLNFNEVVLVDLRESRFD